MRACALDGNQTAGAKKPLPYKNDKQFDQL